MKTFGFQWHLTNRCNLRCGHCYQDDFTGRGEPGFDALLEMAERIFGALRDREISVNLTGGEPLFMPRFFDLVERLHSYGSLKEAHVLTNGTIATDEVIERLRSSDRVGHLKVSIESGDGRVNDAIRGAGDLETVSRSLDRLIAGAGKPAMVMMTLARYNLPTIRETVRFAKAHGASGLILERFVPLGKGRSRREDVLDAQGWLEAVKAVVEAAGMDIDPATLLPYRAFWLWLDDREEKLEGALCNLGSESMALMPDGTVFPCRRLPVPIGNVLRDPIGTILSRLGDFGAPVIRKRLHGGLCGLCGVEDCAGCRALARALTGDILADDPQCLLHLE